MKKQNPASFEDFMKDEFFRDYSGHKDTFEDDFNGWLENLDGEDYMRYGEKIFKLLTK